MTRIKNAKELGQRLPKVKLGDKVKMASPDLYGLSIGEVVDIHRAYKCLDRFTGKIDPRGLVTTEDDIKDCCLPYRFDGQTLEVDYPENSFDEIIIKSKTEKAVFYGYIITVETSEMRTMISERHLSKVD